MKKWTVRFTPRMRKAIAILALSKPELIKRLQEEVQSNPVLEADLRLPLSWGIPVDCDLAMQPGNGGLVVFPNEEGLPYLKVRPVSELSGLDGQAKRFHEEAVWLVSSVARRQEIVHRVGKVVADHQNLFLLGRQEKPSPLTLREVASRTGFHASTVARAVARKFLWTPGGPVSLSSLVNGRERRQEILQAIRELIDREDPGTPFSDGEIVFHLRTRGWAVARRTVVQYRSRLGIPPLKRRRSSMSEKGKKHGQKKKPDWHEDALTRGPLQEHRRGHK